MSEGRETQLKPSDDLTQAHWIRERLVGFGEGVYSVVPDGFPAYVRLFHPAYEGGHQNRLLRWAAVAERAGTTMHGLAQFDPLSLPLKQNDSEFTAADNGNLEPELLGALCEVLGRHTTVPDHCWFCLWVGYGWLHPGAHGVITFTPVGQPPPPPPPPAPPFPNRPLVHLPNREYLLFSGPVLAALEMGHRPFGTWLEPQSPNLFWPEDRAWCVATEIDLDSTYIGCSEEAAAALLADPRLETWLVDPANPISWDSDTINPLGDREQGPDW